MKVLAIETTGSVGSFAVVEAEAGQAPEVLADVERDIMGRHVEASINIVDEVLRRASVGLEDLAGVAVSLGPGSFTGLRVGLGMAKGICVGAGLALVGVPTLDCLARPLREREGLVVPARDARRGEVYCCIYRSDGETLGRLSDYLSLPPEELVKRIEKASGGLRVTLVGDGLIRYAEVFAGLSGTIDVAPGSQNNVRASVVGAMGIELMSAGKTLDLDSAEPIYVRPSEAERKRAK